MSVKLIIVISGKRKSGKDFVADNIVRNYGDEKCVIVRLAGPIKKHFCNKYGLDYNKMLTASEYKEKIRQEMILWGEEQRNKDVSIFCRTITEEAVTSGKSVWIISDARRETDVEFFRKYALERKSKFNCIRVVADIETRTKRGWTFTSGVDNVISECGLDAYKEWDIIVSNSACDNVSIDVKRFCDTNII